MKKLSKIVVLCLTLLLVIGSCFILTACDDDEGNTQTVATPTKKVTFYRNYFTGADDARVYEPSDTAGGVIHSITVKEKQTVKASEAKIPNRLAGYEFDGWYTEPECKNAFDFSTAIIDNIRLYAKWTSNGLSADVSLSKDGKEALLEQTVAVTKFDKTLTQGKMGDDEFNETDQEFADRQRVSGQVSTGVWRYFVDIPNAEKSFNFVTKGFQNYIYNGDTPETSASFEIFIDEACKKLANNPVALENGDNFFYMRVTAEDDIATKVYKINLYLTPAYQVNIETINNSGNFKVSTVPNGTFIDAPTLTATTNPGYSFQGWYYMWTQQLNDAGEYVDADGNVLERAGAYPHYVYYRVNSAGARVPVYTYLTNTFDDKGNLIKSESGATVYHFDDNKYYKVDKNGKVLINSENKPIEAVVGELYNVLDDNGMPTYLEGIPVSAQSGLFECKWDFDKCAVDKNVTIYGKWKPNTYTVTLNLNEANENVVSYSGDTSFTVKYGIKAEALGNLVKTACANHYPTHEYATFLGWEDEAGNLMVNANGIGLNSWNIAANATLYARWNYNTYNVALSVNDLTMGDVSGGGDVRYGGSTAITATPKTGYEFVNWTLKGNQFSTLKTDTYLLDLADLVEDEVSIIANFRIKTVNVTLDYQFEDEETLPSTAVTSLTLSYGDALFGNGANALPVMGNASPNGERLYVGWFYDDADNNPVQLTDKNTAIVGNETWSDAVITYLQSVDNARIYVIWNPNNYKVSVYNAMYGTANMGSITPVVTLPDDSTGAMNDAIAAVSIDGYGVSGVSTTVTYNTKFSLTPVNKNATLYRFIGWYYVDMTADNPLTAALASDMVEDEDATAEGLQFTLGEGDVNIVAVWHYQPVTILLFNEDGTAFSTASVQKDIGKTYTLPLPDGLSTYNFVGWATRTGRLVTDEKGNSLSMLNNTDLITSGLELFAKWKKKNYFTVSSGIITGLTEDGKNKLDGIFEIPTTDDNGNDINGILNGAFKNDTLIKHLTIYGNIKNIGEGAFEGSKMTSVTFSGEFKGLTVGNGAFKDCSGLTAVVLPDATVSVEAGAFEGCYKLATLTYPATVPLGTLFSTTEPEDSNWYAAEQNGVTYFLPNLLKTVIVSNTSDTVCDYAFENCVNVVSITLATEKADKPYTKNIGKYAFALTGDSTVNRPAITVNLEKVENIGYSAFLNSGITSVNLGALSKLGDAAFRASAIESIDFSTSPIEYISSSCFRDCTSLTNVIYGNVNTVYNHAFDGCRNYVTVGANAGRIKIIQSYAYFNTAISSVVNFSGVEQVGQYAFQSNVPTSWYAIRTSGLLIVGKVIYFYKGGAIDATNNNATSIAMGAFENAAFTNTDIDLSGYSALNIIYNNAFEGSNITEITLPTGVIAIKENAFKNCKSLTTVDLSDCTNLKTIGASTFSGCSSLTTVSFITLLNNSDLMNSVKLSIAEYAFEDCTALNTITLPDNLASLGNYAFKNCTLLVTVNFVKNAKYEATYSTDTNEQGSYDRLTVADYVFTTGLISVINEGTFYGCSRLKAIELPHFITSIGNYAFYNCSSLESGSSTYMRTSSETAQEFIYNSSLRSINDYAFTNTTVLSAIDFGTDINSLGVAVFENCKALQSISIVNVTSGIPSRAFNGCENLTSVTTASSISSVGEMAFQNCFKLSSLTATNGIGDVGSAAFKNCRLLDGIKLMTSSTATDIGEEAFRNCSALTTVTIPSTIITIGANAFADCTSLNSVYFGSQYEMSSVLEVIGISAFENTALISVTLPASVKNVEASAFANNKKLVSVTLDTAVVYIGADAFEGCNNITIRLLGTTVPTLGGDLFTEGNVYTVVIRSGYLYAYENSEDWAVYKDNIVESAA